jgi:hypothetical protein
MFDESENPYQPPAVPTDGNAHFDSHDQKKPVSAKWLGLGCCFFVLLGMLAGENAFVLSRSLASSLTEAEATRATYAYYSWTSVVCFAVIAAIFLQAKIAIRRRKERA